MSDENNLNPFSEESQQVKPTESKPRPKKSPNRNRRPSNITPKQVEEVLDWKRKLDDESDTRVLGIARFLTKSVDDDDYKFIAKLLSGTALNSALETLDKEEALLEADDFKAGIALGSESRDKRRAHWELAAIADPDAARAVTGGTTEFPASKEAYEEAGKIHDLQTRINDYKELLQFVEEFLA
jgi:hypothetical protein